ncbi:MAG TPA: iron-sulfur cluster assembly protein [Solirubrobacteraceae bacterium]|nr:iron-sulfur cluster assembly protein [Solirubrobacteraceae bacterium]
MTTEPEVLGALAGVRDPELDQHLVELGFVAGLELDGTTVAVRLRLPTFWCAPNFAYLMAVDARTAVEALPGVESVRVFLDDHFTSDEITDAVQRGQRFTEAFPDHADGELDELRTLFRRKAFTARQARLCDALLAAGRTPEDLEAMRVGDLPHDADGERCRELRRDLGLPTAPGSPAFLVGDGAPLTASQLPRFLRYARLVATSLEGNAGLCRGLLRTRYDLSEEEVAV